MQIYSKDEGTWSSRLEVSSAGSSVITKLIGSRQAEWASATQRRLTKTKTVLSEIRGVKIMGLEEKTQHLLQDERAQEIKKYQRFTWVIVWVNVVGLYHPARQLVKTSNLYSVSYSKHPLQYRASFDFRCLCRRSLFTRLPIVGHRQSIHQSCPYRSCYVSSFAVAKRSAASSSEPRMFRSYPGLFGEIGDVQPEDFRETLEASISTYRQ